MSIKNTILKNLMKKSIEKPRISPSKIPENYSALAKTVRRKVEVLSSALDFEVVKQNTLIYWAKAANLIEIQKVMGWISGILDENIVIPRFECIPVFIYDKWLAWGNIDEYIRWFFEKFKWSEYILRSSAVYSEDWEETTWAWVYDSIPATTPEDDINSFDVFKEKLLTVFNSVDSGAARNYRSQNWIETEKMWVIVQEYIDLWNDKWYVDSIVKNVPELMRVTMSNTANIIDRNKLMKWFMGNNFRFDIYHCSPDMHKVIKLNISSVFSKLCILLESLYGKPVQIEIWFKKGESFLDGDLYSLFQIRPLPANFNKKIGISFPDGETIFTWKSIWVWDLTLDVISNLDDNSNKEWVVIFNSSDFATEISHLYDHLPKRWAVIVIWPSKEGLWHIETICAEKGVLCIFNKKKLSHKRPIWVDVVAHLAKRGTLMRKNLYSPNLDLKWFKKLRIVSDWLEWRVYWMT